MPTHIHLILKQMKNEGISKYTGRVLNGYARYFNTKRKRQGPLWAGRFKSVRVKNDNQLWHLTRYIHLNPTSVGLVHKPDEWHYSSYGEYIEAPSQPERLCQYKDVFDFSADSYKKFVADRQSYQQNLAIIKSLLIEDYTPQRTPTRCTLGGKSEGGAYGDS